MDLVVVAAPTDEVVAVERLLADFEWGAEVVVVPGGVDRRQSVAHGLAALPPDVEIVLVHDAARPLAPPELAEAVAATVRDRAEACVPVVPLADTVKEVAGDQVVRTLDRSQLRAVQTPQGFRRTVLAKAHAWAATADPEETAKITDDASLVERIGGCVATIPGVQEAFKVTQPNDLLLAEALLARRRADGAR